MPEHALWVHYEPAAIALWVKRKTWLLQKIPRKQTALSLSLSLSISISIYQSIYLSLSIFISISFFSFSLSHTHTFSLSLSEHTNGALGFPILGCPVVVSPIHCSFTKGENWTMHFQPSINLLQEVLVTDWLSVNINVVLLIIPPWTDMSSSPHVYIDWQPGWSIPASGLSDLSWELHPAREKSTHQNAAWAESELRLKIIGTVKPALSDHRFKRPPAFSDRFFMHGESAIQNDLY